VAFKKIIMTASVIFTASMTMAEPAQKATDLNELYELFEKSGYSSLELMETTKRVFISGIALNITQSFSGNSILEVSAHTDSKKLARLTAANDAQEKKLTSFRSGAEFKAVCDLAFSSGSQYISFTECIFK
jgi:hypothetical protein